MKNKYLTYGFAGLVYMFICIIYTKIFYRKSRLIRIPFDLRGSSMIDLGNGLTTGKHCRVEALVDDKKGNKITFGKDVIMNDNVHIAAAESVNIGDNVLIGSKVFISDHNHGQYGTNGDSPLTIPNDREIVARPVHIERNVWIGEFVAILPGVTIGEGSIIGALSLVNKSIPKYSIAVGSPARVVKVYNFESKEWQQVK